MAKTLAAHRSGPLAYHDVMITSGPLDSRCFPGSLLILRSGSGTVAPGASEIRDFGPRHRNPILLTRPCDGDQEGR